MKKNHFLFILGVTLVYFVWSFFLLRRNQIPPIHDAALCFGTATEFFRNFFEHPRIVLTNPDFYPPLYMFLPLPFFKLFSAQPEVLALTNIGYFALLLFSVYMISQTMNKSGILALIAILGVPAVIGYYRVTHLVTAVSAVLCLWFYFLMKTDYFRERKYVLASGLIAGIGMLEGFHFACYALGITFVYVCMMFSSRGDIREKLINLSLFAAVTLSVMSVWYIPAFFWGNFRDFFHVQLKPRYELLSPRLYFELLASYGRHWNKMLLTPLFVFSLISPVILYRKKMPGRLLTVCVLGWLVIPLFVLVLLRQPPNTRYLLPMAPAAVIVTACAAGEVVRNMTTRHMVVAGLIWMGCLVFSFRLQYTPPQNSNELMSSILDCGILSPYRIDPRILETVDFVRERAGTDAPVLLFITDDDMNPSPLAMDLLIYRLRSSGLKVKITYAMAISFINPAEKREKFVSEIFDKARFIVYIKSRLAMDTTRPDYFPETNRMFKTLFNAAEKKLVRILVDRENFYIDDLFLYEKKPSVTPVQ